MKQLIYLLTILSIMMLFAVITPIYIHKYNTTMTTMTRKQFLKTDYNYRRKKDMEGEKKVAEFLDSRLYNLFNQPFYRNHDDSKLQYKGVDIQFNIPNIGYKYICDEKCSLYWANKNLKTFALELNYINNGGNLHIGWLLDSTHINNSYNFIYLDSVHDDEGDYDIDKFKPSHIEKTTCYIVRKDVLHKYLYGLGWTEEKLLEKSKEIRETNGKCEMCYPSNNPINNIRFHINQKTQEASVNVLITREALTKLADFIYTHDFGNITFNYVRKNCYSNFFINNYVMN